VAIREIVMAPDDRLRQKCRGVGQVDRQVHRLVDDLIETMREARGVGLAAPQVGVPLRLTVIQLPQEYDDPCAGEVLVLINPEIVTAAGEWEPDEGCLSIPGWYANVKRHWTVTVEARDRRFRECRVTGDGLLGQALQHEIDHLNGVLFTDHLASPDQLRRVEPDPNLPSARPGRSEVRR
jgi:peptide deformylase